MDLEVSDKSKRIEETLQFHLLDDDMKQQLDEVAAQANLQRMMMSRAGVSAPSVHSEVGDIPEDELERVDANIFRPVENSSTSQVIQYLALKPELQHCKVSIAQRHPGFFSPSTGERLPSNWSVVIIIPSSSPSSHSHSHPHSHSHSH